jgi:hypothetical protein
VDFLPLEREEGLRILLRSFLQRRLISGRRSMVDSVFIFPRPFGGSKIVTNSNSPLYMGGRLERTRTRIPSRKSFSLFHFSFSRRRMQGERMQEERMQEVGISSRRQEVVGKEDCHLSMEYCLRSEECGRAIPSCLPERVKK